MADPAPRSAAARRRPKRFALAGLIASAAAAVAVHNTFHFRYALVVFAALVPIAMICFTAAAATGLRRAEAQDAVVLACGLTRPPPAPPPSTPARSTCVPPPSRGADHEPTAPPSPAGSGDVVGAGRIATGVDSSTSRPTATDGSAGQEVRKRLDVN